MTPTSRAVLFVDVTGSTRLYEALGDAQAHAAIARLLGFVEAAALEQGGWIVKRLGDGLMCAFEDAAAAVRAAEAMQRAVAQGPEAPLAIHVGCHEGPVLEAAGDLYGDAVNVAARVTGLAKAAQILVTREVVERLDAPLRERVRRLGRAAVKGRRGAVEILELVWAAEGPDELTVVRPDAPEERASTLTLVCAGRARAFDGAGPITLGRDPASDVVVQDVEASRRHARIERRGGAFVLTDHSANGTWLATPDGAERCLRREEVTLPARGRLALGRRTSDPGATVVQFGCDQTPPGA